MSNKKKELKPYMAYSICAGPQEGAFLVFDYTARKAKITVWPDSIYSIVEDFIDLDIRLIKDATWLFEEKVKNEPHVVTDPKYCIVCNKWGHLPIGKDGICDDCKSEDTFDDSRLIDWEFDQK